MTLNDLVQQAASSYPDALVLEYWDMDNEQPRKNPAGTRAAIVQRATAHAVRHVRRWGTRGWLSTPQSVTGSRLETDCSFLLDLDLIEPRLDRIREDE